MASLDAACAAAPQLAGHGRCEYSGIAQRPAHSWKNGARLAVYVAVNLEHFTWQAGLGARLVPADSSSGLLNYTWREYGNRVGAWRLLDTLALLNLPVAVLANSAMFAHCPGLMRAYLEHAPGAELVGHGRTNAERQDTMTEEEERTLIAESTAVLAAAQGRPPAGWLSPWIAESDKTSCLLAEHGYSYTLNWAHDDAPVRLRTRSGRSFLSVPYPQDGTNDIPAIVARQETPQQFADAIIDAFDELYAQATAGGPALVMGIALHPYIVAQPHRLGHLRRALAHVAAARPGVWLCTPGEVAAEADALLPPLPLL